MLSSVDLWSACIAVADFEIVIVCAFHNPHYLKIVLFGRMFIIDSVADTPAIIFQKYPATAAVEMILLSCSQLRRT